MKQSIAFLILVLLTSCALSKEWSERNEYNHAHRDDAPRPKPSAAPNTHSY
jgi:hypothetical protein